MYDCYLLLKLRGLTSASNQAIRNPSVWLQPRQGVSKTKRMPVPQQPLSKMGRSLSSTIDIEVVLSKLMRDVSIQQVQSAPMLRVLRQCRRTTSDGRLRIGEHEATVWLTQVPRTHTRRETAILRDDQTSDLTMARFALLNGTTGAAIMVVCLI